MRWVKKAIDITMGVFLSNSKAYDTRRLSYRVNTTQRLVPTSQFRCCTIRSSSIQFSFQRIMDRRVRQNNMRHFHLPLAAAVVFTIGSLGGCQSTIHQSSANTAPSSLLQLNENCTNTTQCYSNLHCSDGDDADREIDGKQCRCASNDRWHMERERCVPSTYAPL